MKDLESQLVERPTRASQSFWSRLFSCFSPRSKKGRTNPAEYCPRAMEPVSNTLANHSNLEAQVLTRNRANSATTNDVSELETRESPSLGSACLSGTSTTDEPNSELTQVEGNITDDEYIFAASAVSSEIATVHETVESTEDLQAIIFPRKVHIGTSRDRVQFKGILEAESPGLATIHKTIHDNRDELIPQWRMEDEDDRHHKASEGHKTLAAQFGSHYSVASKVTAPTSNDVEMANEGLSDVWVDILGGPRAPKLPSAKERLKAQYARPRPLQKIESAGLAAFQSQFSDHEVEEPFQPARARWAHY